MLYLRFLAARSENLLMTHAYALFKQRKELR
jgi:hypothetical protein